MLSSKLKTISLATTVTIMAVALVVFPQESFEASKSGLHMWWQIVFPSLLPFLILSELLISFGVVSFLGVILEPLMRPFFRVPGVGGICLGNGTSIWISCGSQIYCETSIRKTINSN